MTRNHVDSIPTAGSHTKLKPIAVGENNSFALNGVNVSYRFHVDPATGDLISDHFGGLVTEDPLAQIKSNGGGWSTHEHLRREFPDLGRGDFRSPAVRIRQLGEHAVSRFEYQSYTITDGKPALSGLPSTFGKDDEVATLIIHLHDKRSSVRADVSYSIFPKHDAIARSVTLTNDSDKTVNVEKLASFSVDLPAEEYEMLQLRGEWFRECTRDRRKIEYGTQGFGSSTGFSSHHHNPFLSVVSPTTTESHGDAWGFSLVYTGSFSMEVEKSPQGLTRVLAGIHPNHLSWPLGPGESFTSPECISIFSESGIGGMSRKFHRLYRQNLIRSKFVNETRPILLNSWEGLYFDFEENTIYKLAQEAADLGVELFVLDDGWFGGPKYPRINDHAGLGDWHVNSDRFPNGLDSLAERIKKLEAARSKKNLQFGLWFEPEMVNPKSELYEKHPDWVMHAADYPRTETRNQLILNLALPEVQDYVIASVANILDTVPIDYVKWDQNRGIHESSTPNHHPYILGMYRVFDELTSRFPHVLWEGCASGGARFDPGVLQYFPQIWTSDNTDAVDRITIQFGTSLVYPPSSMGAHVSAVPNENTRRITPIKFRAHVAMMGGSFGLELNPEAIPAADKAELPALITLAEKVNPVVIHGDMWRLSLPEQSNHPAALFISEDGSQLVLFVFQIRALSVHNFPTIRLQGLDPAANYKVDGEEVRSGATLMRAGIQYRFEGDYDSKVVCIEKL
ncbi:Melibiase-domain-containing protein [Mariannaea sp. PMI_226]|nr:Melibiase-domain-containing protein [Mariannaea sp. PMI_226]